MVYGYSSSSSSKIITYNNRLNQCSNIQEDIVLQYTKRYN